MLACSFDVSASNTIGLLCAFGSAHSFHELQYLFQKGYAITLGRNFISIITQTRQDEPAFVLVRDVDVKGVILSETPTDYLLCKLSTEVVSP